MIGTGTEATTALPVTMRRAEAADCEAICRLVSNEEELFLFYSQGRYPFTAEQARRLLEKRIEPTVMLIEDEVAGFGCFYRFRAQRSVFIGNIAIDEQQRGRGLGRRLVQHLMDLAFDEYDLPRVKIHVFHRNLTALLLYGDLGFRPYAMRQRTDYNRNKVVLLSLGLEREAARASQAPRAGMSVFRRRATRERQPDFGKHQ